jgi:hypothetical protein
MAIHGVGSPFSGPAPSRESAGTGSGGGLPGRESRGSGQVGLILRLAESVLHSPTRARDRHEFGEGDWAGRLAAGLHFSHPTTFDQA